MLKYSTEQLRELDKQHLWHPFTQMQDWCADDHEPMILESGEGAMLRDSEGNDYIDGNASIWTNVHGHSHPKIVAAISEQAAKLAHCSALGYTNEPAIKLAKALVDLTPDSLTRVFFSDDGSTAIECACKMAIQYRQLTGEPERTRFISFNEAYHGDTAGAASLGGIGAFQDRFEHTGFRVTHVPDLAALKSLSDSEIESVTAITIEPLIQGAAGMQLWPSGMLTELRAWCDVHDVFLIYDEVMTGFGKTGTLFAFEQEPDATPDFLCLAKGLTGGTMPLAATLTTERLFAGFLGEYEEQKTFFYGHSYCSNPLVCAAALASIEVFRDEKVIESLPEKVDFFRSEIARAFKNDARVLEIRHIGLIAGIELKSDDWRDQTGARVCFAARKHGLLTRPVRDTLVLMFPLCISNEQISRAVEALRLGLEAIAPNPDS
ncbi:adenosylmethionine--8-amino-7-oxononanoate transaminase [bacterium]|nr:adenosylmethionine--8-amino-7-oxononanoate transaminase [Verrucomicrobiales bacterium]MDC0311834.1 adenosylmethionine--8-amino-7-oxononanoate transaminase [bacterium]